MSETAEPLAAREPSAKCVAEAEPGLLRGFELLATARDGISRLRELIAMLAVRGMVDKPRSAPADCAPSDWATGTLGDVVTDSEAGWSPSCDSGPRSGDAWGVLKVSAVSWGEFRNDENKRLPSHLVPRPALEAKEGDFLLSRANTAELVARSVVAFKVQARLMLSDKIIRLRFSQQADPRFFNIVNNAPDARAYYARSASGTSSSMKNVSRAVVLALPVPIPPLAEQHRIVARVEELMKLCDALERSGRLADEQHARLASTLFDALAASESAHALGENWQRVAEHLDLLLDRPEAVDSFEQTIVQLAVRGLLAQQDHKEDSGSALLVRFQQAGSESGKRTKAELAPLGLDDIPFSTPELWAWTRLGDVVDVTGGVTLGRKGALANPLTLPYLRVANVQRGHLNLATEVKSVSIDAAELSRFQLKVGDLLITEGGDWDKVGRTCIWRNEIPTCLHQNHIFRARGRTAEWSPEWGQLYLNSADAKAYFASSAKQTTNLASINMTQLRHCALPLPPLAEQLRIVARVEELRQLCANLRRRLTQAQEVQSSLADTLVAEVA